MGLTSIPRLNVFVKPLGRFGKGSDSMGLAAPHANHRDHQKDCRGGSEEYPTEVTATDRAYDPENG